MSAPWIDLELENNVFLQNEINERKKRASSNLRKLREAIGVNQDAFAKVMGVSRAALSYYENGSRTPDIDFINKVHLRTSCDLSYLLGNGSVMRPQLTTLELALDIDEEQANNLMDLCAHKSFVALFNSDEFRHVLYLLEEGASDFVKGKSDYSWTMFQCFKVMEKIFHEMYSEHVKELLSDPERRNLFEETHSKIEREYQDSYARAIEEKEGLLAQSNEILKNTQTINIDNPFEVFRHKMECLENGEED